MSETFLPLAVKTDQYPTLRGSKPQTLDFSDRNSFMTALPLSFPEPGRAVFYSRWAPSALETKTTALEGAVHLPSHKCRIQASTSTSDRPLVVKSGAERTLGPGWRETAFATSPFSSPSKLCTQERAHTAPHPCMLSAPKRNLFFLFPPAITNAKSQPRMREVSDRSPRVHNPSEPSIPRGGCRLIATRNARKVLPRKPAN